MKKGLLLFLGLCIYIPLFSQAKYADYTLAYFSKTYNIEIGEPDKNGIFKIFIDIQCSENADRPLNLMINSDKIDIFKESVEQAKEKYVEWRQVAIDNKVDNLNKDIDVKIPSAGAAFIYGEWCFDFSVKLAPRFLVLEGGRYLLIIDTDKIIASDNQFMDTEGYIVFSSVDEIDSFIGNLDLAKMQEFTNSQSSTEDLFE